MSLSYPNGMLSPPSHAGAFARTLDEQPLSRSKSSVLKARYWGRRPGATLLILFVLPTLYARYGWREHEVTAEAGVEFPLMQGA